MITWFREKVISWARKDQLCIEPYPVPVNTNFGDGIELSLHKANGGYVVQFSIYDRKKDERIRNLHLISSDEDMGDKLSKIITFEMLRQ